MPPSKYLHSFPLSMVGNTLHNFIPRQPICIRALAFSTSVAHYATVKKPGMPASPKKGVKSLNTKKGQKSKTREIIKPAEPGERRAQRKRIILTNDNALEVLSLENMSKENVFSEVNEAQVMGLPEEVVDKLRAVDAFKTTQGWSMFRRPAALIRKETNQVMRLFQKVEADNSKKTIRRILAGRRMSGKTTLLLQALATGFLREWFVINIPEAQDIVNAHTDYSPLPNTEPILYTQNNYTAHLLHQILASNRKFLTSTKATQEHDLPIPIPENATLADLLSLGEANPDLSWPIFTALWTELSQPSQPPILLCVDGLAHVLRNSEYMSAECKPIHAHDLAIVRHFVDHLSGQKQLPNGGIVLGVTSESNKPSSPALDFYISVAEALARGNASSDMSQADPYTVISTRAKEVVRHLASNPTPPALHFYVKAAEALRLESTSTSIPQWNPYTAIDARVVEVLKDLAIKDEDFDVISLGGLSKDEARTILEYYAESGMLRHQVNDMFVSEKWSLAGMGNVGELERATVRSRA